MNIIAIDLSMTSTGIAVFVNNKFKDVYVLAERKARANEPNLIELKYRPSKPVGDKKTSGKRKAVVNAQKEIEERFIPLSSRISELIYDIESFSTKKKDLFRINKIVFEGLSFGSRGDKLFNLGKLTGIVQAKLVEMGYEFDVIPPKTVKKVVVGSGNAPKNIVAMKIFKLYDIDLSDYGREAEDMYDAIAVGHAYLKNMGEP